MWINSFAVCVYFAFNSLSLFEFFLLLYPILFMCRSISGAAMFNVTTVWGVRCFAYKKFNHITVPFVSKAMATASVRHSFVDFLKSVMEAFHLI